MGNEKRVMGNGQWSVEGACVVFCHGPLAARAQRGIGGG